MLIAMAGLPASGKSTVARRLAVELPAVLLDKDAVRAALFAPADIDYSDAQNDLCVRVMFDVAAYLLRKCGTAAPGCEETHEATRHVILDGRTFSRRAQVDALTAFAAGLPVPLRIIECVCSDETARVRLGDGDAQAHVARNRDYTLYAALRDGADPIDAPRLVLRTDSGDVDAQVRDALDYVRGG